MKRDENASIYMLLHQILHLSKYQVMKRTEAFGLKPSHAGILFVLNCEGRLSQRQLAERIGITPPSMTVALRKLESRGYIVKEPDKRDQRIVRICLSSDGKKCIEELKGTMKSIEDILYQGISTEEKLLFRRLILEMRDNLLESKEFNGFKGMDMRSIMKRTGPMMKHDF